MSRPFFFHKYWCGGGYSKIQSARIFFRGPKNVQLHSRVVQVGIDSQVISSLKKGIAACNGPTQLVTGVSCCKLELAVAKEDLLLCC